MAGRPPFSLTTPRNMSGWRAGDDPFLVAETIAFTNNMLRDATVPLAAARQTIIGDVEERFDTETDPEGHAWEPWADSYKYIAEQENKGILEKTSDLRDAAVNESSYDIRAKMTGLRGGEIALVGSNLPDYWVFHQIYGKQEQIYTRHTGESYRAGGMPTRPFLGVSDRAAGVIYETFDLYYSGVFLNMTEKGVPIFRMPGERAKFVSPEIFRIR